MNDQTDWNETIRMRQIGKYCTLFRTHSYVFHFLEIWTEMLEHGKVVTSWICC